MSTRDNLIGKWLSAALDDPNVCAEMKTDIAVWLESAPSPPRYEFVYCEVKAPVTWENLQHALNRKGLEGWQVVCNLETSTGAAVFLLQREIMAR